MINEGPRINAALDKKVLVTKRKSKHYTWLWPTGDAVHNVRHDGATMIGLVLSGELGCWTEQYFVTVNVIARESEPEEPDEQCMLKDPK
jgi:hypothetical protein